MTSASEWRVSRCCPLPVAVAGVTAGVVASSILTALSFATAPELAPGSLALLTAIMASAALLAVAPLGRGIAAARPARA